MLTSFELQLLKDFEVTGEAYESKKMCRLFLSHDDPIEKKLAFKKLLALGFIKMQWVYCRKTCPYGWYIRTNKSV